MRSGNAPYRIAREIEFMETGTVVSMVVILGGIWGGFVYFLYQSVKGDQPSPGAEASEEHRS